MFEWLKNGGIIVVAVFGGFIRGVTFGLSTLDNECLERKCDSSNGKYDFCEPKTVWVVKESK